MKLNVASRTSEPGKHDRIIDRISDGHSLFRGE